MRVVIQRVSQASVAVDGKELGAIRQGFMILVGVTGEDQESDVDYLARKIAKLRIFADENGKMNLDISQVGGSILSISQFTLYASTKKGNRPSFLGSGDPDHGRQLYNLLNEKLSKDYGIPVETGEFGADMQVSLINDGLCTILLDSKDR